jgi:7,8-dihydroneopterin aldolase/epimerase/oxygenase
MTANDTRIRVRDLILPAEIGTYPDERGRRQRVRINLLLSVTARAETDRLSEVVDYHQLVKAIQKLISSGHVNLVETLAERIAALCLADSRVDHVSVGVEKLDAIEESVSVGVEIDRAR